MSIDVAERGSDGWWLQQLATKLAGRQQRLHALNERYEGRPPLPVGAENAREAYRAFQRKARTNYSELIVEAVRERMQIAGFRTAATQGQAEADEEARRIWEDNGGDVLSADVHEWALSMGDAYVIVGAEDGQARVTGEDPRQVITVHDPARRDATRAALKMFHDPDEAVDLAFLYLPGRVRVAARPRNARNDKVRFDRRSWDWDDERSGDLPHDRVPVVRLRNKRGVAEFEPHTDLLDRINHMLLQRMVIATFQAFRQRAVKGLPDYDEYGNQLDWSDVFTMDPGALWQVPNGVDFWESGQGDLQPILNSVRDDVKELSAVSRTPLSHLQPESANQSAEGAAFMREGLVFKTEDRIARASQSWRDVMSLAFAVEGQQERSDRSAIRVLWQPAARRSLAERADAAQKSQDLPWRYRMEHIWGFTPAQIDEMEAERASDQLMAAEMLAESAGQASEPQPEPAGG